MEVTVQEVRSKRDLKKFIFLPEKIHLHHSNWVPPVYSDEWKFYDGRHNKSVLDSEVILLLALRGETISGRIMCIINRKYNEMHGVAQGRFFNFECFDDKEVSHVLIKAVEAWATEKGMKQMIGPFGFSDKDPQGLQVAGFEHMAVIATATNLPYLKELVEEEGYEKQVDCIVYRLPVPDKAPDLYQRINDRLQKSKRMKLVEFRTRRELRPYIVPVFRLVNETYKTIFGFTPLTEEEMFQLAGRYLPILDPAFTKLVINNDNQPIAFVIASPDISEGIRKARGRIFPFGFIHILSSGKRSKQLDLFLGAVDEKFQGAGLTALLGVSLFRSARQRGLEYIDSHLILETNKPMREVMERLGAEVYKRYRVYKKELHV